MLETIKQSVLMKVVETLWCNKFLRRTFILLLDGTIEIVQTFLTQLQTTERTNYNHIFMK